MPMESFGNQKVIRHPHHPPILQPAGEKQVWIWCSPTFKSVQVRRHWNATKDLSELCTCDPPCRTMREELFGAALLWIEMETWELRLAKLPASGIMQLIRMANLKGFGDEFKGIGFSIQRRTKDPNSSCVLEFRHHNKGSLPTFDVAGEVLYATGIASEFFSNMASVVEDGVDAKVALEATLRAIAKPKIPLGNRQRK